MQAQQEENVATSPRVSETAPPSTRADARAAGRGALPSLKQVKQPPRRNVAGERSGHGRASATAREWLDFVVPKTAVPEDYHVRETRPVRPDDDEYHAAWDEATKCWQVTIFPSRFPSQREQVSLLRDCLNRMLQAELEHLGLPPGSNLLALLERAEDFDAAYAAVTSIYTAGVQEVSRQVSVHCVERAHLLQSVWSASELLRVRAMAIKEGRISELAAKLDELQARRQRDGAERRDRARVHPSLWCAGGAPRRARAARGHLRDRGDARGKERGGPASTSLEGEAGAHGQVAAKRALLGGGAASRVAGVARAR